ncbi:hypothetical protein RND81_01G068200 [Saponaria officinalis]|uniref:OVATE domain-containing protein n=1 Tax=Saponaria officinalis TaxID=3572 RepID=A0AAW1ND13_SAPOF
MKSMFSFKTKSISLKSLSFPQCRPKSKFRLTKRRSAVSSKAQTTLNSRSCPKKRSESTENPVPVSKVRIAELLTVLFSLRKLPKEVDTDDSSDQVVMSDNAASVGVGVEPVVSPTAPKEDDGGEVVDEVEDLCRSFESCLVEMIVGEGKLTELVDVEELLYCWKNLKSPIFVDLVCRFYEDVCKDLFSPSVEDGSRVMSDGLLTSTF